MENRLTSSQPVDNLGAELPASTRRRFVQQAAASSAALLLGTWRPFAAKAAPLVNPVVPAAPITQLPMRGAGGSTPRPLKIDVPQSVLDDLHTRLAHPRWPDEVVGAGWDYGTNREYLQQLTAYWQQKYDWRLQEAKLNQFPQFMAQVAGTDLHFLHIKGKGPHPVPLLLTHGWPDSFYRMVKIIPLLTDPANYGGRAEDAFTVVVPDIPGFGFSQRPTQPGTDTGRTADLFAELMTGVLGYGRFLAHGGDFGASITEQLALRHAALLPAIHLTNVPPQHAQNTKPEGLSLSPVEQAYLRQSKAWAEKEGAFTAVQTTKPQTLSYGLNDSPVGLASWIVEKFHGWSDCRGDLESVFTKDELLTNIMIYWVTQTIGSSARFYYEKAHNPALSQPSYVQVPTGFAAFVHDIDHAPRPFAERFFNVQRWAELPRGGHFAALEVPEVLATQLREFFRPYRAAL